MCDKLLVDLTNLDIFRFHDAPREKLSGKSLYESFACLTRELQAVFIWMQILIFGD